VHGELVFVDNSNEAYVYIYSNIRIVIMSSGGSKFNVRDENRKNVLTMPDSKCEDVSPKLKGYICYGIGPITESNYYCDVCDKLKEEKKKKVIDPDFRYDSSVRYDDSDKELDYYKYLDLRKKIGFVTTQIVVIGKDQMNYT
jgi:hypothetical protein